MARLNILLVGISVLAQAVEVRAAARHVVVITVQHAVEARTLRVPLQHQYAQLSAPVKAAEVLVAVSPAAETIAHHVAEITVLSAAKTTVLLAVVTTA